MAGKKIQLKDQLGRVINLNTGATDGATVGKNLYGPDGKLLTAAQIINPAESSQNASPTVWKLIREVPTNIQKLAKLVGKGMATRRNDGEWALRTLQKGTGIDIANSDGEAGDPTISLEDVADSGNGALLAITRDGKGRVTGTRAATITGTANQITVTNGTAAAGMPTIALADLANSGAGAGLVKITRDAKGRVSGTQAASTTDLAEGANLYYSDARADARIALQKGQPNGIADLDAGGKIPTARLPAIAITETFVVASQAAQLALTAQEGDVAVRTDQSKNYIRNAGTSGTMTDWTELLTPAAPVQSVNGKTGTVNLVPSDIGAATAAQGTKADSALQSGASHNSSLSGLQGGSSTERYHLTAAQAGSIPATAGSSGQVLRGDGVWSNELLGDYTFRSPSINNSYRKSSVTASGLFESLMGLNGYGATGTAEALGGTLNFRAAEIWTPTANGSTFEVRLVAPGTTTLAVRFRVNGDGSVTPASDNAQTLGAAATRWSVVYAGTGSINTSDAREKTVIRELNQAELASAIQLGREIGAYQWLASLAEKGSEARWHIGMTVQRAIEVMRAHGLDPFAYGFICHDDWAEQVEQWDELPEIRNEDGVVKQEARRHLVQPARAAGDLYSFRPDGLHAFILRGLVARMEALEARAP